MVSSQPITVDTDRQLFVDDFWIDRSSGVERVLHPPVKREIAIPPDKPWEAGGVYYSIVFPDGGKYRMWYRCDPVRKGEDYHDSKAITAYAESDDGIHWEKPDLGLIEYQGSKHNNIVWTEPGINFALFKDGEPRGKKGRAIQGRHPGPERSTAAEVGRRHRLELHAGRADSRRPALRHAQ